MLNTIHLMGRISSKELKLENKDGKSYLRFKIAVERNANKDDEKVNFLPVVIFGKSAEFLSNHAMKGSKIYLQGSLNQNIYQNKFGQTVSSFVIIADNVQLLDRRKNQEIQENHADDLSSENKSELIEKENSASKLSNEDEDWDLDQFL